MSPFKNTKLLATQVQIRPAQLDDGNDLLAWRNDPITRANSLDIESVPFEQHCLWFESVLLDEHQFLKVGLLNSQTEARNWQRIGMVRFAIVPINGLDNAYEKTQGKANKAIVSINLNPDYRGKGLSVALLSKAIETFNKDISLPTLPFYQKIKYLEAIIKVDNIASIRCFEKAGFVQLNISINPLKVEAESSSQMLFQLQL